MVIYRLGVAILSIIRHLILFGAHRWNRETLLRSLLDSRRWSIDILVLEKELPKLPVDINDRLRKVIHVPDLDETTLSLLAKELTHNFNMEWAAFAFDDYTVEIAAALSEIGGRPYMSRLAGHLGLYKPSMRHVWNALCREAGGSLHEVPFQTISFGEGFNLTAISQSICLENGVIVKPAGLDASIGVRYAETEVQLESALEECTNEIREAIEFGYSLGINANSDVILEQAIPRTNLFSSGEFSAEFLSIGGHHRLLGITQKFIDKETFTEIGHLFPSSSIPQICRHSVEAWVPKLLDYAGVINNLTHWEFIITPENSIALVEVNMRPPGDRITSLISGTFGIDIVGLCISSNDFPPISASRIGIVGFPKPEHSVQEIVGVISNDKKQHDMDCELNVDFSAIKENSEWILPISWRNRYISVFAYGATPAMALEKCSYLVDGIYLINNKDAHISVKLDESIYGDIL